MPVYLSTAHHVATRLLSPLFNLCNAGFHFVYLSLPSLYQRLQLAPDGAGEIIQVMQVGGIQRHRMGLSKTDEQSKSLLTTIAAHHKRLRILPPARSRRDLQPCLLPCPPFRMSPSYVHRCELLALV